MSNRSDPTDPLIPKTLLITIDGPAGSGKTTVSKKLAERLDYQYVDTGALYRGIAYEVQRAGISETDNETLSHFCKSLQIHFRKTDGESRLFSGDRDISDFIRTPDVSMTASAISAMPAVRKHLLNVQRNMGKQKAAVFEGRDMGTVVFPQADVKFYLDATIATRAKRRHTEMADSTTQSLADVEKDIQRRDYNDSHRELAPLKPADDAIIIDTTYLNIDEVVALMLNHISSSRS